MNSMLKIEKLKIEKLLQKLQVLNQLVADTQSELVRSQDKFIRENCTLYQVPAIKYVHKYDSTSDSIIEYESEIQVWICQLDDCAVKVVSAYVWDEEDFTYVLTFEDGQPHHNYYVELGFSEEMATSKFKPFLQ